MRDTVDVVDGVTTAVTDAVIVRVGEPVAVVVGVVVLVRDTVIKLVDGGDWDRLGVATGGGVAAAEPTVAPALLDGARDCVADVGRGDGDVALVALAAADGVSVSDGAA